MQSFATGIALQCGLGIGARRLPARTRRGPLCVSAGPKTPSWELEKPERLWEAGGELWWALRALTPILLPRKARPHLPTKVKRRENASLYHLIIFICWHSAPSCIL